MQDLILRKKNLYEFSEKNLYEKFMDS